MNNSERRRVFNFLEELSWVFKSHKNIDLAEFLNELNLNDTMRNSFVHNDLSMVKLSEKERLIGILPNLLNDKKLFSKNLDLIEFAESAFNIVITRKEKRSRYEIIGLIIIELLELKNQKLLDITDSIQYLSSDNHLKSLLRVKKQSPNFSWNEAIREITNQ